MADPIIHTITDATVALGPAPAVGQPIVVGTLTDYKCQVSLAEIRSTSASTTTERVATFCQAASEINVPVASTFTLALEGFQDWSTATGISSWLFSNDATTKAFALYLNLQTNPSATGRITVQAGAFAGSPQAPLTFAVEMPIDGYPDIKSGNGVSLRPMGVKAAAAPGSLFVNEPTVTASDSTNAAKLAGLGFVASPTSAWTSGQKITLLPSYDFNWSGTAWAAGAHALMADEQEADEGEAGGRGKRKASAGES